MLHYARTLYKLVARNVVVLPHLTSKHIIQSPPPTHLIGPPPPGFGLCSPSTPGKNFGFFAKPQKTTIVKDR